MEAAEAQGQVLSRGLMPTRDPAIHGGSAKKRRKKAAAAPRLSFEANELHGDEDEPHAAGGIGAATDKRFEAEGGRAHKQRTAAASPTPPAPTPLGPLVANAGEPSSAGVAGAEREPLLFVGAAAARGARPYMEDRHAVVMDMGTLAAGRLDGVRLALVLDGHGGSRCADFALRALPVRLAASRELGRTASDAEVEDALCATFASIDADFLQEARAERLGDGTTVVCALLRGTSLTVANVGDSRAVLGRRAESRPVELDGPGAGRMMRERELEALRLSVDHKPNVPEESKRIQSHGGLVRCINGCWRVVSPNAHTMLAISRALGDRELKDSTEQPLVSCAPYVHSVELTPRDQFVILASDGAGGTAAARAHIPAAFLCSVLSPAKHASFDQEHASIVPHARQSGVWDVIDDAAAVKMVVDVSRKHASPTGDHHTTLQALAQEAAQTLVAHALKLGSLDNTTALVAWFAWE